LLHIKPASHPRRGGDGNGRGGRPS
jgi:hypothetical protein